jgi:hypothetical protein
VPRSGREDRAVAHQFAPQRARIREIAVVGERNAAAGQVGEHWLDVAWGGAAGRRIAVVAYGKSALEIGRPRAVLAAENVADQTGMPLGYEMTFVEGDDAGGFLPAMLKRMKTKHCERAGVGVAENAEHSALFVQLVAVKLCARRKARHGFPVLLLPVASMSLSSARRSPAP